MKVRRFEHLAKNRFWEVYWDLAEVEIVSGTLGSNGRAQRKDLVSPHACAEYIAREVAKLVGQGFEEVVPEVVKNQTAPQAAPPPELVQRIVEAPAEDQPRMVYADWLQTHGDPLGELIAVQLELARCDRWARPPKLLRDREEALLTSFRQRWLPNTIGAQVTFVRGFADSVKLELPLDGELLDRVVAASPLLRTLVLMTPPFGWADHRWWRRISPRSLAQLTGVAMGGFALDDAELAELSTCLTRIDRVAMRSMQLVPSQLKRLAARDWTELDVHANALGRRGAEALVAQPRTRLVALDIGSNEIGDAGLARVAEIPTLQRLSLRRSQLTAAGLPELARLAALRALDLSCNAFDAKAVAALAGLDLPSLVELDLRETGLDDAGLGRLLASPLATRVESLDLAGNALTDARLLADAALPALRVLHISGNPIAAAGKILKDAMQSVRVIARVRV